MIATVDFWSAAVPRIDPGKLARSILLQPRFRIRIVPPHRTVWDRLLAWLSDRWNALFGELTKHVHFSRAGGEVFGYLLLAAAIALVAYSTVRLVLSIVREAGVGQSKSIPLRIAPDAQALYAQSDRAAAAGRYALAMALLFRACVQVLEVRGVVADDASRTVNECRRIVRKSRPEALAAFDAIARPFTAAVYAEQPIAAEQWREARDAYARLNSRSGIAA